jgi:hypothetical protein
MQFSIDSLFLMEHGDANEFQQSEWRRLLGLLDRRKRSNVIDLETERKKRAARMAQDGVRCRPQSSSGAGRRVRPDAGE